MRRSVRSQISWKKSKKGEEEAYENLPDSIRDGKRGEEMQGYIETLDGICDCLEEAVSWICQI